MRAAFVDVNPALAEIASRLHAAQRTAGLEIELGRADITPDELPAALAGAEIAVIDHTNLPEAIARRCTGLRHVVFLGTGARSYMNPEALAALGIEVHIIKGYGDTAVAECAMGLLWAAARGYAAMDRAMRAGQWLRSEGVQLTGKTLGLVGFGGIGAEMARLALGIGMNVVAWNRQPKTFPGVRFVALDALLRRQRRGLDAPAAVRRDARLPVARAHRGDAAGRDPRQHGARRAGRRSRRWSTRCAQVTLRTPASTCSTSSRCRPAMC